MKMLKTTVACGLLAVSTLASAEHHLGTFSANVALTSDYVFRGISQTDNDPAIQGGFDWNHGSGVYAGVWGSNIDEDFLGANLELDTYVGFSTDIGGFGIDVGFIHYDYPGGPSGGDVDEVYLGASFGPFSAKYSEGVEFVNGTTDFGNYLELGADFELPWELGLGLHVGQYDFKDGGDYVDWKLALSKQVSNFTFELGYTDTDEKDFGNIGDERFILSVSASL